MDVRAVNAAINACKKAVVGNLEDLLDPRVCP